MNCIIIEDQPPAQRILKKYIGDLGSLSLRGTFPDAIQAAAFLKTEKVDLLFLDIHLPKRSGLEFLSTLKHPPYIILTTAFSKYALESYEFNVVDYLLKPFSFQRFVKAVTKAQERQQNTLPKNQPNSPVNKTEIYIKCGYELIRVQIADIWYITVDADYTELITSKKKYISNEPLRYWLEILPEQQFCRIHKSHMVNLSAIAKLAGNQVYLIGGLQLPIGRAYKEAFLKQLL